MSGTSEVANFIPLPSPSFSQAEIQQVQDHNHTRIAFPAYQSFTPLSLQRVKWNGRLLMVGIVTTLGIAVPVGYNIGVINSTGDLITQWLKTTLMDRNNAVPTDVGLDLIWSTVVAIFLVGGAIGSLGGAWVADRFGR